MSRDRRKFICESGAFALLAVMPSLTISCNRPEATGGLPPVNRLLLEQLGPELWHVLELAARAPSGHNTQPWTIRIVDKLQWVLGIEAYRRLPAVDPAARETLLSLGAFLETLIVAAAHYGYAIDYETVTKSSASHEVIDLQLHSVHRIAQPVERIVQRRTLRNAYRDEEIRAGHIAYIVNGVGDFQYFPRGSAGAGYLSEGTIEANRQQLGRDDAEEELARWIRWSFADTEKYRNGLTPASMEIEGLAGWYVRHFYNRASVMSRSFRETGLKQVTERVRQGGGWLVLSSPSDDVATLVETGRTFQRMWLRLRDKNIAIHPMTQMLEERPWREQVATGLSVSGRPQFILRIGYVNRYPLPVSLRMPPSWFLQ